jgi:hypothetical protein
MTEPTYRDGKVAGADSAWTEAVRQAALVSVECEKANNVPGFRAAEEVCAKLMKAKKRHLELLRIQVEQENAEHH